ncbi:MAG: RIP metalloprotease RseP, partial [Pseudomonadota bacterium]
TLDVTGPYPYPAFAFGVNPQSAAIDAGLSAGDVILSVNGTDVISFSDLQHVVARAEGSALTLDIWRDGVAFSTQLSPRKVDIPRPDGGFDQRWLIGITGGLFFEPETETLGPWPAVTAATQRTGDIIQSSLSGLWHILTGAISTCNLSGPVTIAETSGQMATMGTITFLSFIAVLSTAIGLMNLFPIPMLDGGHLVFYAYEAVTGRTPSDRAYQVLMVAGFSLVMTLMTFALITDIFCP